MFKNVLEKLFCLENVSSRKGNNALTYHVITNR